MFFFVTKTRPPHAGPDAVVWEQVAHASCEGGWTHGPSDFVQHYVPGNNNDDVCLAAERVVVPCSGTLHAHFQSEIDEAESNEAWAFSDFVVRSAPEVDPDGGHQDAECCPNCQRPTGDSLAFRWSMDFAGLCDRGYWGQFNFGDAVGTTPYMTNIIEQPIEHIQGHDVWLRDVNAGVDTPRLRIAADATWETSGCSSRIRADDGNYFIVGPGAAAPGQMGMCICNGVYNGGYSCDGDAGQSNGIGAFSANAANEIGCDSGGGGIMAKMHPGGGNAEACYAPADSIFELHIASFGRQHC